MVLMPLVMLIIHLGREYPKQVNRVFVGLLLLITLFAPGVSHVTAETRHKDQETTKVSRREGTALRQVVGQIVPTGRRWSFVVDPEDSFRIVENLALQRMVQSYKSDPTDTTWLIDGELTEFLGENFLMLKRISRARRSSGQDTLDTRPLGSGI